MRDCSLRFPERQENGLAEVILLFFVHSFEIHDVRRPEKVVVNFTTFTPLRTRLGFRFLLLLLFFFFFLFLLFSFLLFFFVDAFALRRFPRNGLKVSDIRQVRVSFMILVFGLSGRIGR